MPIGFKLKDILHAVDAEFVRSALPGAKKPYRLKPAHQTVLDVHAVASKAEELNLVTDPKVIEDGVNAYLALAAYLLADGYRIKTRLFELDVHIPGEYDGIETHPPEGVFPAPRFRASKYFRKYLKDKARIEICGKVDTTGIIGEVFDEATGLSNAVMTRGSFLVISGRGLKIEADDAHKPAVGLFFMPPDDGPPVKADVLPVNEPRTLKALVPGALIPGREYTVKIVTQSTTQHGSTTLKTLREIHWDRVLTTC